MSTKKSSHYQSPSPQEIKAARKLAKLTQPQAAALVFCSHRTWQEWESGKNMMSQCHWQFFLLKISIKNFQLFYDLVTTLFEQKNHLVIKEKLSHAKVLRSDAKL